MATWCCKNQLLINTGTQQLLRRLPNEIAISFLWKEITPVSNAKDLGIILDSNLTYDQHIHQLTSSCMTKLCQINGVKNSFDWDTLRTIISALVLSKLFYCSTIWSNTTATNIKKLQALTLREIGFEPGHHGGQTRPYERHIIVSFIPCRTSTRIS